MSSSSSRSDTTDYENSVVTFMDIYKKVQFNEFIVFILFFSTMLVWPGLITLIPSYSFPSLNESSWWSLILLFWFSICDCIGRYVVQFRFCLNKENIWIPVAFRFLLIPVVILVAKGLVFTSDVVSLTLVGILGFTNGYLGSLSILMVNDRVHDGEKGTAGMITGLVLNLGLVMGSSFALGVQAVFFS